MAWRRERAIHLEPGTLRDYESVISAHVLTNLANSQVSAITTQDIRKWLASMQKREVSRDRQRRALKMMRMLLTYGMESGYLTENPATIVKMPKAEMREPIIPLAPATVEKMRAYFHHEGQYHDALLICLMAYAGLRPNEATGLTWADVRERTLVVGATKTGKFRSVDVLAPLAADIKQMRLATDATGPIYPRPRAKQWTHSAYRAWRRDVFNAATDDLKIKATPYTLRHSFASLLAYGHYPVPYAAEQMGHSPSVHMDTYQHVIADIDPTKRIDPATQIAKNRRALYGHARKVGATA